MATKLRKLPSSHYLTALAIADSGMLLCHILLMSGGASSAASVPGLCQLTFYSGGVFSFLSVWFVVSFTLERFIAVRYPLRRLQWCTVGRARVIVCCVAAFACLFNSHILISAHAVTNPLNQTECNVREGFIDAASTMNHIDTALTFVIPLILIVVWNTAIAVTTLCSKARRESFGVAPRKSTTSIYYRGTAEEGITAGILLPATAGETFLGGASRRHVKRRLADDRKITRMLLIVSLIFLLMNFPDYVIRMVIYGLFRTHTWETLSNTDQCWIETSQKITTILFNTNFAVNFFLYSLVGANFRDHLKKLLYRFIRCIFEKLDNASPAGCKLRRCPLVARIFSCLAASDPERSRIPSTSNGYGAMFPIRSSVERISSVPVSPSSIRYAQSNDAWSPSPSPARKNNSRRMTAATTISLRSGVSIDKDWEADRLCSGNDSSPMSPPPHVTRFLDVSSPH